MDDVNELGKEIKKIDKKAKDAAKSKSPEYGMGESARDIFDAEVPYVMTFNVPKTAKRVTANVQFELPPPDIGLGQCCGDCYCIVNDYYPAGDITGNEILLTRPYVAGTVRLFVTDFLYMDGVTETDPAAGIVTVDNFVFNGSRDVTISYVYQYDVNCTTNIDPEVIYTILDDFLFSGTSSIVTNKIQEDTTTPANTWFFSAEDWSADGEYLILSDDSFGAQATVPFDNTSPYNATEMPWQDGIWSMRVRFTYTVPDTTDDVYLNFTFGPHGGGATDYVQLDMIDSGDENDPWGSLSVKEYDGASFGTTVYYWKNFQPSTFYILKAEHTESGSLRAKIWAESDTEPEDWQVTTAVVAKTPYYLRLDGFGVGSVGATISIDYISFGTPLE